MFLVNRTNKKIAGIDSQTQAKTLQAECIEERLLKLQKETKVVSDDYSRMTDLIESERRDQAYADASKNRLEKESEVLRAAIGDLRQQIQEASRSASEAKDRKDQLLSEVIGCEDIMQAEHKRADAAAAAARKRCTKLLALQEEERIHWDMVSMQHGEVKRQLEAAIQQCDEARRVRDDAKNARDVAQKELDDIKAQHDRLLLGDAEIEGQLALHCAERDGLEKELLELEAQRAEMTKINQALSEERSNRQMVLKTVSEDLETKQLNLQETLKSFEGRFESAKERRMSLTNQTEAAREVLTSILSDYFALQTEYTAKKREAEAVHREHEVLSWEHYKVLRDLQMLAKSYDPGFEDAVPPTILA